MAFFQYLVFDGESLPLPDSCEVEPVSYTHLDVYKRQPYHCPWMPTGSRRIFMQMALRTM